MNFFVDVSKDLVGGVLGCSAIGVHFDEIESAVETALQHRHVHVEGELFVHQVKHAVPRTKWEFR